MCGHPSSRTMQVRTGGRRTAREANAPPVAAIGHRSPGARKASSRRAQGELHSHAAGVACVCSSFLSRRFFAPPPLPLPPFLRPLSAFLAFFASLPTLESAAASFWVTALPPGVPPSSFFFFSFSSALSGLSSTAAQKVHARHLQNLQLRAGGEARGQGM